MLPKYVWLMFFITTVYMLHSSNYYKQLGNIIKKIYKENIRILYEDDFIKTDGDELLFTKSALKKYTSLENGLYLAILGQVFDVTNGAKHYGPGETYHPFTGRDGSAAFITGDFTEIGLTDDISSLTNKQIQSLINWVEFYRKTYVYKGKLIGRYYNKDGTPTNERHILEKKVQIAKKSDLNEEQRKIKFPACNVMWEADKGTKIWCTKNSGGVTRNWIGVPRMLYDSPEKKRFRCACINLNSKEYQENKEIIKEYEECNKNAVSCIITKNN